MGTALPRVVLRTPVICTAVALPSLAEERAVKVRLAAFHVPSTTSVFLITREAPLILLSAA